VSRICIVNHIVSFRKSHDGLLGEAFKLGLDPYKGDLVVFIGRHKNAIKILFSDRSGIWVGYKKFHQGVVSREFKFLEDPSATMVSPSDVTKLIEGTRFETNLGITQHPSKLPIDL
jgi:hypothetical protein